MAAPTQTRIMIGERMRLARKKRGFTLADVAGALGVTASCVSYWENGRTFPGPDQLPRLANALGVTVDALVSGLDRHSHETHRADVVSVAKQLIAQSLRIDVSNVRVFIEEPGL